MTRLTEYAGSLLSYTLEPSLWHRSQISTSNPTRIHLIIVCVRVGDDAPTQLFIIEFASATVTRSHSAMMPTSSTPTVFVLSHQGQLPSFRQVFHRYLAKTPTTTSIPVAHVVSKHHPVTIVVDKMKCTFPRCNKRKRRGGRCFQHGGGTVCKVAGCSKSSQSSGLCYAHGGGTRCSVSGCNRSARLRQMCRKHAESKANSP